MKKEIRRIVIILIVLCILPIADMLTVGKALAQEVKSLPIWNLTSTLLDTTIDIGSTYEDMTVTSDYTLDKDLEIGTLNIDNGRIILNGHKLIVHNSSYVKSGGIIVGEGQWIAKGDVTVETAGYISMDSINSQVDVYGNLIWNSTIRGKLNQGVLSIFKNLKQSEQSIIDCSKNHTLKIAGDAKQLIQWIGKATSFGIVMISNTSSEGVVFSDFSCACEWNNNGSKIAFESVEDRFGWKLEKDEIIDGDLQLTAGVLDLNGYTLHITGDILQKGGIIKPNSGMLIVDGNYRMQSMEENDGAIAYLPSGGYISMVEKEDSILIHGDFIYQSNVLSDKHFVEGTINVEGDFVRKNGKVYNVIIKDNFISEGTKIILSGKENQTVDFQGDNCGKSSLMDFELQNNTKTISYITPIIVKGAVKSNNVNTSGLLALKDSGNLIDTYHGDVKVLDMSKVFGKIDIEGDFTITQSRVKCDDTLNISGDLTIENGGLVLNHSKAIIEGNLNVNSVSGISMTTMGNGQSGICMVHEDDLLIVQGDYSICAPQPELSLGRLKVSGNYSVDNYGKFVMGEDFICEFNGTKKQIIQINTAESTFGKLVFTNTSKEGIDCQSAIAYKSMERNGVHVSIKGVEGEFGWTLKSDEEYDGDLVLIGDKLDLDGHKLHVKGNLIQSGGDVVIHGGELVVDEDYRIQTRQITGATVSYGNSSGTLTMMEDKDHILVKGSFYQQSTVKHKGLLTNGVLEIQGDFSQLSQGDNFVATAAHKVILNGQAKQSIYFTRYNGSSYNCFANLEIDNNSIEGCVCEREVPVSGAIDEHESKITGTIGLGSAAVVVDGKLGCKTKFYNGYTIKTDTVLDISGDVEINGYLYCYGELHVSGNMKTSSGITYNNGGKIKVDGDMTVACTAYGSTATITMSTTEDLLLVRGSLSMGFNKRTNIDKGKVSVEGNVNLTNVSFNESSELLLNGAGKQSLKATSTQIDGLTIDNNSNEGVCIESPLVVSKWNIGKSNVYYMGKKLALGWVLDTDETIDGDLDLMGGTMNLNGHKLTVKGNLNHSGGTLDCEGGHLIVQGDYFMQSVQENEVATNSTGLLVMQQESDIVEIFGDTIIQSNQNESGYLINGLMKLYGDFTVNNYSTNNFRCAKQHTVSLCGEEEQMVDFGCTSPDYSAFSRLDIVNEKVVLKNVVPVINYVDDHGNTIDGLLGLGGTSIQFANNTIHGNLVTSYLKKLTIDDINIVGTLKVGACGQIMIHGDSVVHEDLIMDNGAYIDINQGGLKVLGDLTLKGNHIDARKTGISMNTSDDYLEVKGDYTDSGSYLVDWTSGRISFGGNVTLKRNDKPIIGKNVKVVLNGASKQIVNSPNVHYGQMELQNYSKEGVYSDIPLNVDELITNGCHITYGDGQGVLGYRLNENQTIEGDMILVGNELDLNGHTLEVNGDFVHAGGTVNVNNGHLIVNGDYRYQSKLQNIYESSNGRILMKRTADRITVNGDMYYQPSIEAEEDLSDGVLEISGNIAYLTNYAKINTASHVVKLIGSNNQIISGKRMNVANLSISKGKNSKVTNNIDITVGGNINTTDTEIKGTGKLSIKNMTQLKDFRYGGTLVLEQKNEVAQDYSIDGELIMKSQLKLSNHASLIINKLSLDASVLTIEDGTLLCRGDLMLTSNSGMIMRQSDSKAIVGGEFTISNAVSAGKIELLDGTLELNGKTNILCGKNVVHSEVAHTTVFNGIDNKERKLIQQFTMSDITNKLGTIQLQKTPDAYSFSDDIENMGKKIVWANNDITPPDKAARITIKKVTASEIELFWANNTEEDIKEYCIYRDGVQIAKSSTVGFHDSRLMPDTEYKYQISAMDDAGNESEKSDILFVKTEKDTQSPTTPKNLYIKDKSASRAVIAWDASTDNVGVKGYIIYRNGEELKKLENVRSYTDMDVVEYGHYRYSIVAYDGMGNLSEISDEVMVALRKNKIVSVEPEDGTQIGGNSQPLKAVFSLEGCAKGNKCNIAIRKKGEYEWTDLSTNWIGQKNETINTASSTITWNLEGIRESGSYECKYTIQDTDDNEESQIVTYDVDCTAPESPEDVMTDGAEGMITVRWSPSVSADCSRYMIYRRDEEKVDYHCLGSMDGRYRTLYEDRSVESGKKYQYRVTACDAYEQESAGTVGVMTEVKKDTIKPSVKSIKPANTKLGLNAMLAIEATDNVGVKKISGQYRKKGETDWKNLDESMLMGTDCQLQWENQGLNGQYEIKIIAEDSEGNQSEPVVRTYEVDTTGPATVQWATSKAQTVTAQLYWNKSSEKDIYEYKIERLIRNNEYKVIGTVRSITTMTDVGLEPCTTYEYRITGIDDVGNEGDKSETLSLTTKQDETAPVITKIEPSSAYQGDSFDFSIDVTDNVGVSHMEIYSSRNKKDWDRICSVESNNKKSDTYKYNWNITALKEGSIFIKMIAYDQDENATDPLIYEYTIDHTKPDAAKDFSVMNQSGQVSLSWSTVAEDINYYEIWRASKEDGIYKKVKDNWDYQNYTDHDVKYGKEYIYKIRAIDLANNVGAWSESVTGNPLEDVDAPVIHALNPVSGSSIGVNPDIEVFVTDNVSVETVEIEYSDADKDDTWFLLDKKTVNSEDEIVTAQWNTESLKDGRYKLRAKAIDCNGIESESFLANYTYDSTTDKVSDIEINPDNGKMKLQWKSQTSEKQSFGVYRKASSETEFDCIGTTVSEQFEDKDVDSNRIYQYQVCSYDELGNSVYSDVVSSQLSSVDTEKPKAVFGDYSGFVDGEIQFDASSSTDNIGIVDYSWDMGDGSTYNEICPIHKYNKEGDFYVRLTVTDSAGNVGSMGKLIRVYRSDAASSYTVAVRDVSGRAIPKASIYVKLSDGNIRQFITNDSGIVHVVQSAGVYHIAVIADGYALLESTLCMDNILGGNENITLFRGSIVSTSITSKRLSAEEMIQAKIDFNAPENLVSFQYIMELAYRGTVSVVKRKEVRSNNGNVLKEKDETGPSMDIDEGEGESQPRKTVPIITPIVNKDIREAYSYMVKTDGISWLNNVYGIEYGVVNNATSSISIGDASVTLNMPKSVNFAKLSTEVEQKELKKMEDIAGGESKSVTWYVIPKMSTNAKFSATFAGILYPFERAITCSNTSEISLEKNYGNDLTLTIMPETEAHVGEKYYVHLCLRNNSSEPVYNMKMTFGHFESPLTKRIIKVIDAATGKEREEVIDGPVALEVKDPDARIPLIYGGDTLGFTKLPPGGEVWGTYVGFIRADEVSGDPLKENEAVAFESKYFELVKALAEKIGGDGNIKIVVKPIESHCKEETRIENSEKSLPIGDPVDPSTGDFLDSYETPYVTGATTLSLQCDYRSSSAQKKGDDVLKSELGLGWSHNYDMHINDYGSLISMYYSPTERISMVAQESSQQVTGCKVGDVIYIDNEIGNGTTHYTGCTERSKLYSAIKGKDGYQVTVPGGDQYFFDDEGELSKIVDVKGCVVLISRSNNKVTVTDEASGKKIYYSIDKGRISRVWDDMSRVTEFIYADDMLTQIKEANGSVFNYTYDDNGHILTISKGNMGLGNMGLIVTNTYSSEGRVIRQDDGIDDTNVTTYDYSRTKEGGLKTSVTDRNNNTYSIISDKKGQITKKVDQLGHSTEETYDKYGNLLGTTDAKGNLVKNTYDIMNRLISTTDAYGKVTKTSYDGNGNISSVTNPDGWRANYYYDENNRIISSRDYNGLEKQYSYNEWGQIIQERTKDPATSKEWVKEYAYSHGQLVSESDYNGNVTRYAYDSAGNMSKKTDSIGNDTWMKYDNMNRIVEVRNTNGIIEEAYSYDERGNKISMTNSEGETTYYTYDGNNRLTREDQPQNIVIDYFYDGEGNVVKKQQNGKNPILSSYDKVGNVLETTNEDGTVVSYEYDECNQVISSTDEKGNQTKYEYYKNGKPYQIRYPDGTRKLYTYNSSWQMISESDGNGIITTYEYDIKGNITKITDGEGSVTKKNYDKMGNCTTITDPRGNTTLYEYDGDGNCVAMTNALNQKVTYKYDGEHHLLQEMTKSKDVAYVKTYEYNYMGKLTRSIDEEGNEKKYTYNQMGNLETVIDDSGYVVQSNTYNERQQLINTKDADGNVTNYTYNRDGELILESNSLGQEKRYEYDARGRITKTRDPQNALTQCEYDATGNTIRITNVNGGVQDYTYNQMGKMTSESAFDGKNRTYTYNTSGLLTTKTNAREQITTYTYDNRSEKF